MHFFGGQFGGMHLIWWIIWLIFLAWVFFIPTDIPYQRANKDSLLDILKNYRVANYSLQIETIIQRHSSTDYIKK